ncbi:hypothetical protein KKB71_00720 [Patescibacteria group bacterium]|nr:hypothetical protein [Patescibacteria group bacterium]MBU2263407.1 hypothetical protein [Patescibacteria group bacterium]
MKWKLPPKIKIYEALGSIGDDRIKITNSEARVYSSSGNKYYTVTYDKEKNAIMANDNGSYWKGYIGYPSIAYLMKIGIISYRPRHAEALKDIPWKDINIKFRNDFDKTQEYIHQLLEQKDIKLDGLLKEIDNIFQQIENLNISKLGRPIRPPEGY